MKTGLTGPGPRFRPQNMPGVEGAPFWVACSFREEGDLYGVSVTGECHGLHFLRM